MNQKEPQSSSGVNSRWLWLLGTMCLVIALISILLPRPRSARVKNETSNLAPALTKGSPSDQAERVREIVRRKIPKSSGSATAQEIVAVKLTQFAHSRLELARKMAARSKVE